MVGDLRRHCALVSEPTSYVDIESKVILYTNAFGDIHGGSINPSAVVPLY